MSGNGDNLPPETSPPEASPPPLTEVRCPKKTAKQPSNARRDREPGARNRRVYRRSWRK